MGLVHPRFRLLESGHAEHRTGLHHIEGMLNFFGLLTKPYFFILDMYTSVLKVTDNNFGLY